MKYETRSGVSVPGTTDLKRTANFGATYAPTGVELAVGNYILVDWKLDGVSQGNINPSTTMPASNITLILVYGQDNGGNGGQVPDGIEDITITKTFKDKKGEELCSEEKVYINVGDTFNDQSVSIEAYSYVGHRVDGNAIV